MLDGLARRKVERERISSPRKIDRKMASAAGGERNSKTNLDGGRDELHLEKTVTRKGAAERSPTTGTLPHWPPSRQTKSCPMRHEPER